MPAPLAAITGATALRVAATMVVVLIGWAFFRAPVADALRLIAAMAALRPGVSLVTPGQVVLVGGTMAAYYAWMLLRDRAAAAPFATSAPVRGAAYAGMLALAVLGAAPDYVPFIYFQF